MDETILKVAEIFYSIQGESLLVGKPTVFVRLAQCNLRCDWCDTPYAYGEGTPMTLDQILAEAGRHKTRYACVTGGEPLAQPATPVLLKALLDSEYTVSLETNGSYSVRDVPAEVIKIVDIKCPDSGESDKMVWENFELLSSTDQLKFVVASRSDFDWARQIAERYRLAEKCTLLFSPVHGKVQPLELANWILENEAPVTMQVPLHKTIWGPDSQGV